MSLPIQFLIWLRRGTIWCHLLPWSPKVEVAQFGAMLEDLGGRPHHGMAGVSKSKVGENKRSYIFSLCLCLGSIAAWFLSPPC